MNKSTISSVVMNITDACNLRCPYCFTSQSSKTTNMGIIKVAIEYLMGSTHPGTKNFAFFGGEPTLYFDELIVPTVDWVRNRLGISEEELTFSITTNGTLLTKERIDFLVKHKFGVVLSIDGDRYTQDDQRPAASGESSFDLALPSLEYFPESGAQVTFRSTLEPRNAHRLFEDYMAARKFGFKYHFVAPNAYGSWDTTTMDEAVKGLYRIATVMAADVICGHPMTSCETIWQTLKRAMSYCGEVSGHRCGLGTTSIGVATDGMIFGCQERNTSHDEGDPFYLGDVFTGIDQNKVDELTERYRTETLSEVAAKCDGCYAQRTCLGGGCPSRDEALGSGLRRVDEYQCRWFRATQGAGGHFLSLVCPHSTPTVESFLREHFNDDVVNKIRKEWQEH